MAASKLEKLLYHHEMLFFDRDFLADMQKLQKYLHDDFCECGRSGMIYHKDQMIAFLYRNKDRQILIKDFSVRLLSANNALVHYISINNGVSTYRTSIWVKDGNRWTLYFHQGTDLLNDR